jgi:acetylornithine deacetylase/succinyl-diaminopimelate desuccinylase-like protein
MERSEDKLKTFINEHFYAEYLDGLKSKLCRGLTLFLEFIEIESLSPIFDEHWQENRNLFKQMAHLKSFAEGQGLKGMVIKDIEDKGRSPFLIVDVAAFSGSEKPAPEGQVLLYGHMDKQPYGDGWKTKPNDPVIADDRLYGRGSSDDGYAFFSALLSIKAL